MTRILATCAALALTAAFAMPAPAVAAEKRADGVRNTIEQIDVSARRAGIGIATCIAHYGPRYATGIAMATGRTITTRRTTPTRRGYYRPYYGPSVGVGVGPFGFGLGFVTVA